MVSARSNVHLRISVDAAQILGGFVAGRLLQLATETEDAVSSRKGSWRGDSGTRPEGTNRAELSMGVSSRRLGRAFVGHRLMSRTPPACCHCAILPIWQGPDLRLTISVVAHRSYPQ